MSASTNPFAVPLPVVGASSDEWEVSLPFRVRIGRYSWSYHRDQADADEQARKSGAAEVELNPRMALSPAKVEPGDADYMPPVLRVPFGREGENPTAGQVAAAEGSY